MTLTTTTQANQRKNNFFGYRHSTANSNKSMQKPVVVCDTQLHQHYPQLFSNPSPSRTASMKTGGSHGNNVFLNYFNSLSRKKSSVQPTSPPQLKTTTTCGDIEDTTVTREGQVNIRNVLDAKNNINNNSEIARFNLVKSLVRKHELEIDNNNNNNNRASLNPSNRLQQINETESGQQRFFITSKSTSNKLEKINCDLFTESSNSSMRSSDLSSAHNSLNLSPSSSSNSSSNSCNNSGNFSDSTSPQMSAYNIQPTKTRTTEGKASFLDTVAFAFDNLTYSSSVDDVLDLDYSSSSRSNNKIIRTNEKTSQSSRVTCNNYDESEGISDCAVAKPTEQQQQQQQQQLQKKNLKSIKRKDRMKKKVDEPPMSVNIFSNNLSSAQSMPDLSKPPGGQESTTLVSNSEYDKRLRKKFRSKALTRSLRRAKSFYYCQLRSKSLEDLTADEQRSLFKTGSNISLCFASSGKSKSKSRSSQLSASSTASCVSGLASDISSSYFHELSDWSPEFSSCDSDSSDEDELFENVDWENNLSNLALSGFNSENCESNDEDEDDNIVFKNKRLIKKLPINNICQQETQSRESYTVPAESIQNDVTARILQVHSDFFDGGSVHYPASQDYITSLKAFKVTENLLTNKQHHCTICSGPFVINEELNSLECEHLFHSICIKAWLSKSVKCPICCQANACESSCQNRYLMKLETLI